MNRSQLISEIIRKKSFLCVGLDLDPTKLPMPLIGKKDALLEFNKAIIDVTKDLCVAYKINTAFYEALGADGWHLMKSVIDYIPHDIFVIADAKRGDIGNTSHQYAKAFFENLEADAVTLAPYMGLDSLQPFFEYPGKWGIVLGLTSNAGSADFELQVLENGMKLYEKVLLECQQLGSEENLMFVVGATNTNYFESIRKICPNHFLLIPGVGAQGGDLEGVIKNGITQDIGLLINASRSILYASSGDNYLAAAHEEAAALQSKMATFL